MLEPIVTENWKPVVGYEGYYSVSDQGRVKRQPKGRLLSPCLDPRGYLRVYLWVHGVSREGRIHRLVAAAFFGPRPEGMEVNHKNCTKIDNRLNNLEYITHRANMKHAWAHDLIPPIRQRSGQDHPSARLTESDVREIRERYSAGNTTHGELAIHFGVCRSMIGNIIRRNAWKSC